MERRIVRPRPDWQTRVEATGLTYHSGGRPADPYGVYWDESVAYRLTASEVDELEVATNELHRLCIAAAGHIADNPRLLKRFGIPDAYHEFALRSFRRGDPHVYGRFDLAYDGRSPPKMLEYNADTPTLLIETALTQWFWFRDTQLGKDQFNSLHEALIDAWRAVAAAMPPGSLLHFSANGDDVEEHQTTVYMQDLATQAGARTEFVQLEQIGWTSDRRWVDHRGAPIRCLFKLYPWEWLIRDEFGPNLLVTEPGIVEPPWKMLLSNKALLPILWSLFPGHPHLLPAYWTEAEFKPDERSAGIVSKPILSREGANISIRRPGTAPIETTGPYGGAPSIHQAYAALPQHDGQYVVVGSWIAGGRAAGMILREAETPVVVGQSRVVPHVFD